VTEAISCKDAASKDPACDAITFTAYYEPAASWDFSAAAFLSLLPGRQLGTYTQSQPSGTTTAGPSILAATTQSSHQFILFHSRPNWAFDNISTLKTLGIARL